VRNLVDWLVEREQNKGSLVFDFEKGCFMVQG
jgi:hypothetical protein